MKKYKTLIFAILLSLVASVATSSCCSYWYDDGYYYDYPYRGRPGPPPPPPPRPHHRPHHGHGW